MGDNRNKKVAICFFGITRSLNYTYPSIAKNILHVARAKSDTRIFSHFFAQEEISNSRSGESGNLNKTEYLQLNSDWVQIDLPDLILPTYQFDELREYGDQWHDNFQSLRNLVHQLHSLRIVTAAAKDWEPDIYIFLRPDLEYLDSFEIVFRKALSSKNCAYLPNWQHWLGGFNDRFAICVGDRAADAYGNRACLMHEFCKENNEPLHAERLARFALEKSGVRVYFSRLRATRIRLDGTKKNEDFLDYRLSDLKRRLHVKWDKLVAILLRHK